VKLSLIGFVFRRVGASLRQSFWAHLLTSGTVAVTLFVFGGFLLVETNLEKLLKTWAEQIQLTAYLKSGVSAADVGALIERVRALSEVARVSHTTQEQAWRDFQTALGSQSTLLEGLPREVLPASIEISLKSAHRDAAAIERVAQRLKQESGVSSVEYPQEWIERLGLLVLIVESMKWIFGGVLFLATFFIVGSMVKLALLARRDEVEIMQLVGASEELIQAPFVIEGMIQGLAGAAIAVALMAVAYVLLEREIAPVAGLLLPLAEVDFLPATSIAALLAIGLFLGAAGSLISLRRFIKTWHPSSVRA
jgi:cell division transport system permease protein